MTDAATEDDLRKRHEFLLTYARAAFDTEHHRYEWSEVKISRYLTVLTVVLGIASVRLPELASVIGHLSGSLEWGFVLTYTVGTTAAAVALLFALAGLAYHRIPNLAIGPDLFAAVTDNPLERVMPGMAERYLEAARAVRAVNAHRFRRGEIAYWLMTVAVMSAAATIVFFVLMKVKGPHQ